MVIQFSLVKWKQHRLDTDLNQDLKRDKYTTNEKSTEVDHATDELIAEYKRPTRLHPHVKVVRTNLEPLEQEASPLKKKYGALKRWTMPMLPK